MVPNQLNIKVAEAIEQSQDLQQAQREDSNVAELLSYAQRLNGVVRNTSTHAAGVVISQEPLAENVPLRRPVNESADGDWIPMTQWGMDEVAAVGLLKMDFLGLTNLTILEEAVALVQEHEGVEVDYLNLPDGDRATYERLATGDTFGVFQLESGGMRRSRGRPQADIDPRPCSPAGALSARSDGAHSALHREQARSRGRDLST